MNKKEFLCELKIKLSNLPKDDVEERLNFYSEMIDDRIEDGYSEENAIKEIGTTDEIVREIISKTPLKVIIKEKIANTKEKVSTNSILLIVLGFPLWFPLLISLFAILLSLYISAWAIIVSLWSVFISLLLGGLVGIILGIIYLINGANAIILGIGLVALGLSIFAYYGSLVLTKLLVKLTKNIINKIKSKLIKEVK